MRLSTIYHLLILYITERVFNFAKLLLNINFHFVGSQQVFYAEFYTCFYINSLKTQSVFAGSRSFYLVSFCEFKLNWVTK